MELIKLVFVGCDSRLRPVYRKSSLTGQHYCIIDKKFHGFPYDSKDYEIGRIFNKIGGFEGKPDQRILNVEISEERYETLGDAVAAFKKKMVENE